MMAALQIWWWLSKLRRVGADVPIDGWDEAAGEGRAF